MKNLISSCAALLLLAGCSTYNPGVTVAGHPYRTDPGCKRTKPLGKFDEKCDHPRLGWRGAEGGASGMVPGGIGDGVGSGFQTGW